MIYQEFLQQITNLQNCLNEDNAEIVNDELDKIFKFKPVPLEWFIVKAETMRLLKQDTTEIDFLLKRKCDMHSEPEKLQKVIEYFIKYAEDPEEKKKLLFHLCTIHDYHGISDEDEKVFLSDITGLKESLIKNFLNKKDIIDNEIESIINMFYVHQDFVNCIIFDKLYNKLYGKNSKLKSLFTGWPNSLYLEERLESQENELFIFLSDDETHLNCHAAAKAVSMIGKTVFIIDKPIPIETDNKCSPESTIQISFDNAVKSDGIVTIPSVELILNGDPYCDNRAQLINYINREFSENNLSTVMSCGKIIDELCSSDTLNKHMDRLSIFRYDYFECNMAFAWCGNYLSYISNIYGFDAQKAVEQKPECDFSIIIPARNSSATLQHTLKTCLEIDYSGTYEIVISDNSAENNHKIYDLVTQLNDDRIKYFKTPRALTLPRSFEFAFLKSRGDFIVALGSDDGILPWSLNVLQSVLDSCDVPILTWIRGFYAWPGFNGGQQNQFIIPGSYQKNNVNVTEMENVFLFNKIRNFPQEMYCLPTLYINSGFKRNYMKTLLNYTGRLWDGPCQDIYMGIINTITNKEIMLIEYPITIAGMSGSSLGANDSNAHIYFNGSNNRFKNDSKEKLIGFPILSKIERLMADFHYIYYDYNLLYSNLFRAAARGLLNKEFIFSTFNLENMFLNASAQIKKDDVMAEEFIYVFRKAAAENGDEFLKWFDENIFPNFNVPSIIEYNEISYDIGFHQGGGITLDASGFGVKNIYDAVDLFKKLTGL